MKRLVYIAIAVLLGACTRTQYVPVQSASVSVSSEDLERFVDRMAALSLQDTRLQTIFVKESATYTVNETGDTTKAVIERERDSSSEWHTKEAYYLSVIDSLKESKSRVDSVYIEKPVPVETVREVNVLRWWQSALAWSGAVAWVSLLTWGAWKIKR